MVFKLVIAASKTWRRLQGENQLPEVIGGARFQDDIEVTEVPENRAATTVSIDKVDTDIMISMLTIDK